MLTFPPGLRARSNSYWIHFIQRLAKHRASKLAKPSASATTPRPRTSAAATNTASLKTVTSASTASKIPKKLVPSMTKNPSVNLGDQGSLFLKNGIKTWILWIASNISITLSKIFGRGGKIETSTSFDDVSPYVRTTTFLWRLYHSRRTNIKNNPFGAKTFFG